MEFFKKIMLMFLVLFLVFIISACGQPRTNVYFENNLPEPQSKLPDSTYEVPVADSMPDLPSGSLSIRSFSDCVAAGNTVLESDPRQCWTAEGDIFVDE